MFGFGKKKAEPRPIVATQTGKLIRLDAVPDEVFSQGILGEGVAIIPSDRQVFSPVAGKVVSVTDTLHAVCIEAEDGTEFLVHVGLETVSMKGEGFKPLVSAGDAVKAGQPILTSDLELIQQRGLPTHTVTVIADMDGIELSTEPDQAVTGRVSVVAHYTRQQ